MALISCSKKLTINIVKGELTFDHAVEAVKEFYEEKLTKDVLWDLREGTWKDISDKHIRSIIAFIEKCEKVEVRKDGRTAIVVPADIDYGIARAVQSYSDSLPFKVGVFRSMDEAIKWLTEK
jgi:hypothetical protein